MVPPGRLGVGKVLLQQEGKNKDLCNLRFFFVCVLVSPSSDLLYECKAHSVPTEPKLFRRDTERLLNTIFLLISTKLFGTSISVNVCPRLGKFAVYDGPQTCASVK